MLRSISTYLLAMACAALPALPRQNTAPDVVPLGSVLPHVATAVNSEQSYALYLPRHYSRDHLWPILYIFDPMARGEPALQQFQHAAEAQGFIVAASNNSRNGAWAPQAQAAEAMLNDTQSRFAVDLRRIYFAGFSGGARVSARLAQLCKCAAGVILSGAGFPDGSPPSADSTFPVFSAVGNGDFNYPEILRLEEALQKASFPHWLRIFQGPHQWAPPEVMDEALAWFRVRSMNTGREPRNDAFVAGQFVVAKDRAARYEASGDLLFALREYRQLAATFASLAGGTEVQTKADALEKGKAVRDAAKHERNDFEEQDRLAQEVFRPLANARRDDANRADPAIRAEAATQTLDLIRALRSRAQGEKKPERALVLQRALAGIFVSSIESGETAFEKKDYAAAAQDFACAAEANPQADRMYRELAVARALSGDRKGALKALTAARDNAKDKNEFQEWLRQQPSLPSLQ
jgi:predicted esterase